MRYVGYICAEIVTLYAILTGAAAALCLGGVKGEVGQLVFAFSAVAFVPASIYGVLIGDWRSLMYGVYRPIRPLSLVLEAAGAFRGESSLPIYGKRRKL